MKQKMMTWTKTPKTPTDHATMNQNLRRELKMKKVEVNHLLSSPQRFGFETSQRKVIACYVEENEVELNVKQLQVYEEVLRSANNEEGKTYFLDAPVGTENTFLTSLLLSKVGGQQSATNASASSGIAATLLPNDTTVHTSFNLPLDLAKEDQVSRTISHASSKEEVLEKGQIDYLG